jgi:hypothetical protein
MANTPSQSEIAKKNQAVRAAEGRRQVSNFFDRVGSFFAAPKAETDKEGIARRKREREENAAETARVVARRQEESRRRADANKPTAEEIARGDARNTRVDQLTQSQRNLITGKDPLAGLGTLDIDKERAAMGVSAKREETRSRSVGAAAGARGAAAAAAPTTVIEDRLKGEGVNTNTELFERDSEGNLTNIPKASTVDSAFSTGERTAGTFNIGRFRAEVSGADSVLPTHSFLVVFAPMIWTRSKFSAQNLDSLLTMRCDNVVLPSVNLLQEQNIRRYGFGPVENVAYGLNVGDFTLQFIVDKSALVVEYFEEWLNLIVNRDSFGGANMNNDTNGRKPYEIAYKDTYSCPNVNVFVYDRAQNQVMTYNIYDVFPTGIQSMNMSWSEENTLMKLNITFSFTDLRINRIPPKTRVDDTSFKDEIIVTARRNPDGTRRNQGLFALGAGDPLSTSNLFGDRPLELTDLSNETTIIGDFPGRIRGSVPPIPQSTAASTIAPEVTPRTTRLLSGVPFTTPP